RRPTGGRSGSAWSLQRGTGPRPARTAAERRAERESSRGLRERGAALVRLAQRGEECLEVPVEASRAEIAGEAANPRELGAAHRLLILGLQQVHAAGDAERVGGVLLGQRDVDLELTTALVELGERLARTEVDEKIHRRHELGRFVAR